MGRARHDSNFVPTLTAVSNVDGSTPVELWADPTTHLLQVSGGGGGGGGGDGAINDGVSSAIKASVINYGPLGSNPLLTILSDSVGNPYDLSPTLAGIKSDLDSISIASDSTQASTSFLTAVDYATSAKQNTIAGLIAALLPESTFNNAVKAEDAAHVSGDNGIQALTVRKDTAAALAGTDGDYQPAITDASGRMWVSAKVDTALPAGTNAIGKLAANAGVNIGEVSVSGAVYTSVGVYEVTPSVLNDLDSSQLRVSSKGVLLSQIRDGAGNERGANVNASNQLSVSVDNTVTVGSHAVTNAGTFAVQAAEADGANVTLGAKADAKSTATDTTAVSAMSVLKQISASVQAPPSQAVTNAGTFAVQAAVADGASVTLGAKADAKSTATDTTSVSAMSVLKQISASVQAPPSQAVTNAGTFAAQATLQTQTDTVMVGGVNIKEINAVTPLMGNGATGTGSQRVTIANDNTGIATWGQGATAASVPSGATYKGARGTTALPTAVTDGQLVGAMADKYGRQIAVLGAVRDLRASQTTTLSASTAETTIVTAAASTFNDLIMLVVSNTSASTNTRIDFRDTTGGSVLFSLQSPGNSTIGFSVPGSTVPQTTVNTNWTAQCATSTTDVRIWAVYEKNK